MKPQKSALQQVAQKLFTAGLWCAYPRLLIALAIFCCGGSLEYARGAQTDTWSGAGADNNWNTAANWDNAVTTNGDDLIFGVSARIAPANNFAGLQISSITLSSNSYTLSGNALTITNGITDQTGSNTVNIPLTLGASQTFQDTGVGTTSNFTTIAGTIALGTNNLNVGGSGNLYLNGLISSSIGGTLTINNSGIARLGPSANSPANVFGTNGPLTTITGTNITVLTNTTFLTNTIVNGNPVITTNTAITTNTVFTLVTNAILNVADVVAIQGGTLQFAGTVNGNHMPNGASVGNVLVNGTLDVNSTATGPTAETINGLEGSGTVDNLNTAIGSVYTLTVGNGDSNAVFSGTIQNTAGSIALTKTGFGTQTLNNNNTYSGLTTINQGILAVGASGTLGLNSKSMIITPGGVLDVTALGVTGYQPQNPLNLNAGTTTKPYTNFFGSFNPSYPGFVVTQTTNFTFTTNETVVVGVSTNINSIATNIVSITLSSNSIVSVINADVNGNFNLFGGSFTPVAPAPGYATFTVNGNLNLDNSLSVPNNLNFLLNNVTNVGGGINDLIDVKGTLNIGDTVNIVVSAGVGTLASGKYTLMTSTNFVSGGDFNGSGPANFVVIAPRGINGVIDTVSQPGNILLTASGTAAPTNIVWAATNAASDQWNIHVSQNWKNGGNPDFYFSGDNVTFDDTGFGTVSLFGPLTPGSMTFNNNNTNYAFVAGVSGFITGNGGITLNGSGSVTLNNPNSYTGPTTINGGTLIMGSYGGFGNRLLYNNVSPGQLVFGGNGIFGLNWNIPETSQIANFSGLTLNPGANGQIATLGTRASNEINLVTIGAIIARSVGSSLFVNSGVRIGSINSGVYLTNTVPWTNGLIGGWAHVGTDWWLPQTNFGGVPPASGLLNYTGYTNNGALATWVATNNMSVSNSTFSLTASATVNTLKLSGPATVTISSGVILTNQTGGLLVSLAGVGPSVITGGTIKGAVGADLIVIQNKTGLGNELTIGSVIADNGSATALTLGGLGGTLILTNNNTYTGATYVNAGSLQVGAGAALGSIATSSSIIDSGGTLSFNRPDATSVGPVSGTGGITQLGTGTLTLTANNTLKGLLTVSAGTLQVGNGGAAGSISNITSVVDNGTLVFNNSGTLGYGGVISGTGGLVQQGSGTLILKTNETYLGNTIVSNGTLTLVSGSISNTPAIVVNAGATLDVSAIGGLTLRSAAPSEILAGGGTIKGSVTTAAGTKIMPGTNGVVGTLTFNNDLSLSGGSYLFDVTNSPGNSDTILVSGTLNQNSGNVIINVKGTPLVNGLYPLIYATNGLGGAVGNLIAVGFVQAGQLAKLTNSTPNELDLYIYTGVAPSLTWQGDSSQNLWDTTASSIWQGAALYTQGAFVTFDDSGSANPAVNLNIVEFPAVVTVDSTNKNYTFGVNGGSGVHIISGGASLVKNGPGTLTLQTVNDYSGTTTINGGVIQLNGDNGANDDGMVGAGSLTNNGTLIVNNANAETLAGDMSGTGLLVQQGVGKLILAGNNAAYSGPITFSNLLQVGNGASGTLGTGNVTNNGGLLFSLNSPNSVTVSANVSGSGSVTNLGSGTVTLSGTDTFGGVVQDDNGTFVLGSATALPTTTTLVMDPSLAGGTVGALNLNGNNINVAAIQGTNSASRTGGFLEGTIYNNGTTTNTIALTSGQPSFIYNQVIDNNNLGTGKVALSVANGTTLTLGGMISSSGTLPFANTFSAGITISNASVFIGFNPGNVAEPDYGPFAGSGTITLLGGHGSITNGLTQMPTNGTLYSAGAITNGWNGTPTFNTTLGVVNVPSGEFGTIWGSARGTTSFTLTGGGTLVFISGGNRCGIDGTWTPFTGTILFEYPVGSGVANGAMRLQSTLGFPNCSVVLQTNTFQSGVGAINMVLYMGNAHGANGAVFPIGALSGGDFTGGLAGSSQNAGINAIYAIGGLNQNTTFGGEIIDAVGIRQVGNGSLTLTNMLLSWSGQTVVSNGSLIFAPVNPILGLIGITNNYFVASNYTLVSPGTMNIAAAGGTLNLGHSGPQTLFGNGTLNGSLTVSNSLVAPFRRASNPTNYFGNNLTVSNTVVLKAGSTVQLGLNRTNSPPNDSLTAVSITYGGALIVTNFGDTAFPNGSSNVFHLFNGAISGTFTNIVLPVIPTNEIWFTNNLNVNGTIALVNTNAGINPNPPVVTTTFNGTQLTLGWPTNLGWILQSQTNPLSLGLTSNNWFDVAGSATQTNAVITINPTNPGVFFRLRLPP